MLEAGRTAGERDLADERRPVGRGHAGGRRRERGRDGEVGGRVVDAEPAGGCAEQLGAAEPVAGRPDRGRRPSAGTAGRRARSSAGGRARPPTPSGLDLDGEGPPPCQGSAMAAPGTPRPSTRRPVGSISWSPPAPSRTRRTPLGAEAVLPARKDAEPRARVALEQQDHVDRVLERARPGEVAVLGDVAGHQDRDPLLLGHPDEGVGARPDLATPPGIWEAGRVARAWIESTARRNGVTLAGRRQHGAQVAARGERDGVAVTPSRRARAATWRATPRRRRTGTTGPSPRGVTRSWSKSVDFPMPGSPARRITEAGTSPPPSTRSTPGIPVGRAVRPGPELLQREDGAAGPRGRLRRALGSCPTRRTRGTDRPTERPAGGRRRTRRPFGVAPWRRTVAARSDSPGPLAVGGRGYPPLTTTKGCDRGRWCERWPRRYDSTRAMPIPDVGTTGRRIGRGGRADRRRRTGVGRRARSARRRVARCRSRTSPAARVPPRPRDLA